jgi:predicted RNA methylase
MAGPPSLPDAIVITVESDPRLAINCELTVALGFLSQDEALRARLQDLCFPSSALRMERADDGRLVLRGMVMPCNSFPSDHIGLLLKNMRTACLKSQAELRRVHLSHLIPPSFVDQFWGESKDEARARLAQTSIDKQYYPLNQMAVCFNELLAGGGQEFGADAIDFVERRFGKVGRAFEWCAGPGFLGFSLLDRGLCNTLCLADVNPAATEICSETVAAHNLQDRVSVYLSDCFDQIPSTERWDLVIGNPPWLADQTVLPDWGCEIKYQDLGLELHRRFFRDVGAHLNPGARILLLESYMGTSEEDFAEMAQSYGYKIMAVCAHSKIPMIYYLWIERASETPL